MNIDETEEWQSERERGHACVCVCVKFVLQFCDTSDAYCAVLEERLPHVRGEPFVGIARHVGRHNGVIDESREVCAHSGQVTAVCQPWLTTRLIP